MQTSLGSADLDQVNVVGYDLNEELVGNVTFTDMVSLLLLQRWPDEKERRMLDAMLVILIEHGIIGPVVAARFIYSNAPESIQGAVSASLLAAGSLHLGTSELAARVLQEALANEPEGSDLAAVADRVVEGRLAAGERIYGVGHSIHSEGDPRADRLFAIARECGVYGRNCVLIEEIGRATAERHGKPRPVNVTGALAAIASDLGLDWRLAKSFALIGRCLGALGHIGEEIRNPIAGGMKRLILREVTYEAPETPPGEFPTDRWT